MRAGVAAGATRGRSAPGCNLVDAAALTCESWARYGAASWCRGLDRGSLMDEWSSPGLHYPEYPAGSVVELRVHGVGGEPPSVMTRDPHPVQVAGDDVIGVFRARDPVVGTLGTAPDASLHVREVVSWGGQTSGTWRHALWVLLMPFAMFNVAGRMHLPGRRGRLHRMVCRVLGLTMTLTTVGLACTIGMDLVATQYVANWPDDPPFWVAPFRAYLQDPAGSLSLAAILPSVVLIMLWVASRYQQRHGGVATGPAASGPDESLHLTDPTFWSTQWATSRMRGMHVTAGTAWIAGTLAIAVTATPGSPVALGWVVAVQAGVVVVSLGLACLPQLLREEPIAWIDRLMQVMRLAALGPLGFMFGAWLPTDAMVTWIDGARLSPVRVVVTALALVLAVAAIDGGVPVWRRVGLLVASGVMLVAAWTIPQLAVLAFPVVVWLWAIGGLLVVAWAILTRPRTGNGTPDVRGWPSVLLVVGAALVGLGMAQASNLGQAAATLDEWGGRLVGSGDWLVKALLGQALAGPQDWQVAVATYVPMVVLGLLQAGLIGALALASLTPTPRPTRLGIGPVPGASQVDDGRAIVGNAGAVVLAMLSLFILVAVGAGLHGLVADLLGERVIGVSLVGEAVAAQVSAGEAVPIVIVPWLVWSAKVMLGVLVAGPVWAGLVVWRRLVGPEPEDVETHMRDSWEAFGAQGGPGDLDADDLATIGRLWNLQWLLRHAGGVLVASVVGGLAMLVVLLVSLREGAVDGLRLAALDGISMALVVLLPLAGFALVRSSLSARATRRQIGRLWDVLTFWPRVTHPFSPPCYAETLVPGISDRVRRIVTGSWPAEEPPRAPSSVILAGHSQGSMVSLAAAAQLGPVATNVSLVSYGSPIAILYERMFREPFAGPSGPDDSEAVVRHVANSVQNWHHLLAMTEPFAMPFWSVAGFTPDTRISSGRLAGHPRVAVRSRRRRARHDLVSGVCARWAQDGRVPDPRSAGVGPRGGRRAVAEAAGPLLLPWQPGRRRPHGLHRRGAVGTGMTTGADHEPGPVPPDGWRDWETVVARGSLQGRTYRVRSRHGRSAPVIVLHELLGPDRATMDLATWLRDEHGFSVHVPALFGVHGEKSHLGLAASKICLRREFVLFRTGRTSPIVDWLRQFVAEISALHGGVPVGVIGMCLTGGFALALAAEPDVGAAVASQPSLPGAILRSRRVQADLGMAPGDVPPAGDGPAPLMVLRYERDWICPRLRVEAMAGPPLAESSGVSTPAGVIEAPADVAVRQGVRGPLVEPAGKGHAILTVDLHEETRSLVGAWLEAALAPDGNEAG